MLVEPVKDRIFSTAPVLDHDLRILPYSLMTRGKGGVKLIMQCNGASPDFIIL